MSEVQIVLCTFPDPSRARHIGTLLVEKQLAACVNLIPGLESIFSWKGKVSREQEVLAIFKTTTGCLEELERLIEEHHPYDLPELLILPAGGSEPYLNWVRSATRA